MVFMISIPLMVACILLDVCVIIANICEEIFISRRWSSLDRIDHLLLSLSISDLASGVSTLVVDSWFLTRDNETYINGTTSFEELNYLEEHRAVARVFDAVFLFSVFASLLHVTAVGIERVFAIRFPRKYHIFTNFKFKCATISIIWVFSMILTPVFAVDDSRWEPGRKIRSILLTTIVLSVFSTYLSVAYFLFRQRKSVIQDLNPDSTVQQDRLMRLTIQCMCIAIGFVICIAPITLGYYHEGLHHDIANFMVTFNSLVNPCIYFVKVYYDLRNQKRTRSDTSKELISTRSYGYTLTTIADDQDEKSHRTDSDTLS